MSLSTLEVLRTVRDYASDPAHCAPKTDFGTPGGSAFCLQGFFTRWMDFGEPNCESALEAVARVVDGSIIGFYDDPGTTHAGVLAVLDRAIATEDAREQEFSVIVDPVEAPVAA